MGRLGSPGNTPARATVEAKLANPALKVEIMVQAANKPHPLHGKGPAIAGPFCLRRIARLPTF